MPSIRGYSCRHQGGYGTSTEVLSYLASGLNGCKENSLPFRRGSPCCDLFEGLDNRQLLKGYSARHRQEALTNFPITLNPRSFLRNNARSVKGKKRISLPFWQGSPCCDLFEGPDNRQLLEGYSARRRQEASNESFLPRTEVGSFSRRRIISSGDKQEVVSGRKRRDRNVRMREISHE